DFSEAIEVTNTWAELICSLSGNHSYITSGTSQKKVITPVVDFANNESCALTMYASQIHDLDAKDPPDDMDGDYSIIFSTVSPADQPPSVVETFPPDGAVDVAIEKKMSVTFSEPVELMPGWISVDCSKGGSYSTFIQKGPITYEFGMDKNFEYSDTCTVRVKADKIVDVDSDDPPNNMKKDYLFSYSTIKSPDEFVPPTVTNDEYDTPHEGQILKEGINHLSVQFSKNVLHDGTQDSANNAENYRLIEWGSNQILETQTCDIHNGDDKRVVINNVQYAADHFRTDLLLNFGVNLPHGKYTLIICGENTIKDMAGIPLNNGVNSVISFTIQSGSGADEPGSGGDTPGSGSDPGNDSNKPPTTDSNINKETFSSGLPFIPVTGFRQNVITPLLPQRIAYTDLGEEWLEVPVLALETSITGVPKVNDAWDVTWLGTQAGWLEGSAQLGNLGNSVIAAHVWDALNQPGPFYGLEKLKFGDKVILHAWGDEYVYEVREVLSVKPENIKAMMKHQEKAWLTLVTCQGYDEESGEYQRRVLVRAVLMEVR
ncbi:MAG: hypothetical protein CVU45_03870, partial [Chloroflexi bacterium HGW-Chloroflexi-7]